MDNLRRLRRNLLTREKAHQLLNPHYDDIIKAIQEGLNQFLTLPAPLRSRTKARTLSNLLNDCICHEASQRFDGMEGMVIDNDFDGLLIVVEQRAVLRFKKVDGNSAPSNIPTERQGKFAEQQLEFDDDVVRPTLINVGYQADQLFTQLKAISLGCRISGAPLWEIPLVNDMQGYLLDNEGNARTKTTAPPVVRSSLKGQAAG